jgi:cobalt/nickel transport system ATP-binding protein
MIETVHALRFRNVTARYPSSGETALRECTFTVKPGEHVALLGLNGSGKTTLLMSVAGLVETTGEISVDGVVLGPSTVGEVRNRIGMVFSTPEDQLLFPRVLDDVAYTMVRRGIRQEDANKRAREALGMLGVEGLAQKEPYELSHGQRLRVALAGVLVARPAVLLLDEATAALDPPGRRALARLLCETSSAFLLTTHDLEVAQRMCGRFLVLENGRIVADTTSLEDVRHLIDRDEHPPGITSENGSPVPRGRQ